MAIITMTLDEIRANRSKIDHAKLDATTEEDIRRYMIEDGEDPDALLRDEDVISPAYIRKRLGMSQLEFAKLLDIPVATLRNWEQKRVMMGPAILTLMRLLSHDPETARHVLQPPVRSGAK